MDRKSYQAACKAWTKARTARIAVAWGMGPRNHEPPEQIAKYDAATAAERAAWEQVERLRPASQVSA